MEQSETRLERNFNVTITKVQRTKGIGIIICKGGVQRNERTGV